MKSVSTDYAFSAASKQINFSSLVGFDVRKLLAVINVTRNQLIYAAGEPDFGLVSEIGGVVTLVFDTATHADNDKLLVYYDSEFIFPDSFSIDNFPANQPISGSVSVSNFPDYPSLIDSQLRSAPLPISAANLPLPSGAATSANQSTTNNSLASIDSKLTSPLTTSVNNFPATQPISASSLPLPSGAATSANQSTTNNSLASIDSKLNNLSTSIKQDTANSSLDSIDDKLSIVNSNLGTDGSTPPVISGTGIRGWLRGIYEKLAATLTISGSVSVSNLPVTQPVSGSVSVSNFPTDNALTDSQLRAAPVPISASSLPLPAGAATSANQSTTNNSLASIDSKLTNGTQKNLLVDLDGHVANVQNLQSSFAGDEYALITQSILHGKTTAGGGAYVDVKVTPSGALTVESNIVESVLPTGAATESTLSSLNNNIGTDGSTPPVISGTGIRGWLRGIYERLAATLTISGAVSVSNFPVTQPVSGSVSVSNFPTDNALTDAQLRASAVPISAASLPLPAGAATSANQSTTNNSLASIDDKLTLPVKIKFSEGNLSPFGNLISVELEPVFQSDFVYGTNSQIWNTGIVSGTGASVDTNLGRLRIQSGTANNGYAYITSRRLIKYRAGQGIVARFTPMFTNVLTDNIQLQGVGYIANNIPFDGYFFGVQNGSFGIAHYNNGSLASFIPQSDWNGDKCDGTGESGYNWNILYGVPCQIVYPYLGYGNILFMVQNPQTSEWIVCHIIKYSNTSASTQISNASLQFISFVQNIGNTTNLILYTGSVGCFIAGIRSFVANPRRAADVPSKAITSTEGQVISIRNATNYNGVANRGLIRLTSLSIGSSSNTNCVVRFKINPTIGGTPVYSPINGTSSDGGVTITNGNSIASINTAGTTITGGDYVWNISIGSSGSANIDLTEQDLFIAPGEIGVFSAIGSNNTNMNLSINWTEDI